jgi:hypothetical protein
MEQRNPLSACVTASGAFRASLSHFRAIWPVGEGSGSEPAATRTASVAQTVINQLRGASGRGKALLTIRAQNGRTTSQGGQHDAAEIDNGNNKGNNR